jgi:hypothetical protein
MFKTKDPHSFTNFCTLMAGSNKIGNFMAEYHVVSYDDVQMNTFASVNKSTTRKFMVSCTQRINIYNSSALSISPNPNANLYAYENYPVLINTLINAEKFEGLDVQLMDYSPQTVNTKIQSSATSGSQDALTKSSTLSSTVGSLTSETNSYGASVTIGSSDTLTGNKEYASTASNDASSTAGTDTSSNRSNDSSSTAAMSIKDWGAYALVNPTNKTPSWTFGQEYPWDAVECRNSNGILNPNNSNQIKVIMPDTMSLRLYDGTNLYPPSQLSIFGFNFVMKALWLVTLNNAAPDEVTFDHAVNYFSGSHAVTGTGSAAVISAYMDQSATVLGVGSNESLSSTIDLPLMALDPLAWEDKASIIGFIPRRFIVLPSPATASTDPVAFEILSASNNLMINDTTSYPSPCDAGAGFQSSEIYLTAGFSPNCLALQMTVYFKIVDTVNYYTLFMKH